MRRVSRLVLSLLPLRFLFARPNHGNLADGTRPTDTFCREVMESCKHLTARCADTHSCLTRASACPGAGTPASNLAQRNSTKELGTL